MKVVVLTMRLFDQPRTGGELCTARLLRGLEEAGHEVLVMGQGTGPARPRRGLQFVSLGAPVPAFDDMPWLQRLTVPLRALLHGRPVTTERLDHGGAPRQVHELLAARPGEVDALIVDHLQSFVWLSAPPAGLPRPLLVMHNLESDGYRERAANVRGWGVLAALRRWLLRREARLLERLEQRAMAGARVVAALSEPDAQSLRQRCREEGVAAPVVVLPGYTLAPSSPPLPTPPDPRLAALARLPRNARLIGMVGTWTWEPNRAGLEWMLQQVMPLLPEDCHLVLAGGGLEHVRAPPRVMVLGRIADVATLYNAVDLVAIPSVRGSGVHEKAIEAIGTGLTVVATPHALRGLLPGLPAHVLVADGAESFAQRCASTPLHPLLEAAARLAGADWTAQRAALYRRVLAGCLPPGNVPPGPATPPPAAQHLADTAAEAARVCHCHVPD